MSEADVEASVNGAAAAAIVDVPVAGEGAVVVHASGKSEAEKEPVNGTAAVAVAVEESPSLSSDVEASVVVVTADEDDAVKAGKPLDEANNVPAPVSVPVVPESIGAVLVDADVAMPALNGNGNGVGVEHADAPPVDDNKPLETAPLPPPSHILEGPTKTVVVMSEEPIVVDPPQKAIDEDVADGAASNGVIGDEAKPDEPEPGMVLLADDSVVGSKESDVEPSLAVDPLVDASEKTLAAPTASATSNGEAEEGGPKETVEAQVQEKEVAAEAVPVTAEEHKPDQAEPTTDIDPKSAEETTSTTLVEAVATTEEPKDKVESEAAPTTVAEPVEEVEPQTEAEPKDEVTEGTTTTTEAEPKASVVPDPEAEPTATVAEPVVEVESLTNATPEIAEEPPTTEGELEAPVSVDELNAAGTPTPTTDEPKIETEPATEASPKVVEEDVSVEPEPKGELETVPVTVNEPNVELTPEADPAEAEEPVVEATVPEPESTTDTPVVELTKDTLSGEVTSTPEVPVDVPTEDVKADESTVSPTATCDEPEPQASAEAEAPVHVVPPVESTVPDVPAVESTAQDTATPESTPLHHQPEEPTEEVTKPVVDEPSIEEVKQEEAEVPLEVIQPAVVEPAEEETKLVAEVLPEVSKAPEEEGEEEEVLSLPAEVEIKTVETGTVVETASPEETAVTEDKSVVEDVKPVVSEEQEKVAAEADVVEEEEVKIVEEIKQAEEQRSEPVEVKVKVEPAEEDVEPIEIKKVVVELKPPVDDSEVQAAPKEEEEQKTEENIPDAGQVQATLVEEDAIEPIQIRAVVVEIKPEDEHEAVEEEEEGSVVAATSLVVDEVEPTEAAAAAVVAEEEAVKHTEAPVEPVNPIESKTAEDDLEPAEEPAVEEPTPATEDKPSEEPKMSAEADVGGENDNKVAEEPLLAEASADAAEPTVESAEVEPAGGTVELAKEEVTPAEDESKAEAKVVEDTEVKPVEIDATLAEVEALPVGDAATVEVQPAVEEKPVEVSVPPAAVEQPLVDVDLIEPAGAKSEPVLEEEVAPSSGLPKDEPTADQVLPETQPAEPSAVGVPLPSEDAITEPVEIEVKPSEEVVPHVNEVAVPDVTPIVAAAAQTESLPSDEPSIKIEPEEVVVPPEADNITDQANEKPEPADQVTPKEVIATPADDVPADLTSAADVVEATPDAAQITTEPIIPNGDAAHDVDSEDVPIIPVEEEMTFAPPEEIKPPKAIREEQTLATPSIVEPEPSAPTESTDVPSEPSTADEERPKSPWTLSYSVMQVGAGVEPTEPSDEKVPAPNAPASQTEEAPIAPEPQRPKSPWTPSYSTTVQGSPSRSPTPEPPVSSSTEPVEEELVVPDVSTASQASPVIVVEPPQVDSNATEREPESQPEQAAIQTIEPQPILAVETEVQVDEAVPVEIPQAGQAPIVPERPKSPWTPSYSTTVQGSSSRPLTPEPGTSSSFEPVEESTFSPDVSASVSQVPSSPVIVVDPPQVDTNVAESEPLQSEQTSVQIVEPQPILAVETEVQPSDETIPAASIQQAEQAPIAPEPQRPKSPWTPSYSTTVQGSSSRPFTPEPEASSSVEPVEEESVVPDVSAPVPQVRSSPVIVVEPPQVDATASDTEPVPPAQITEPRPVLAVETETEVQVNIPERPKSPWTPSYSVTTQGSPLVEAKSLPPPDVAVTSDDTTSLPAQEVTEADVPVVASPPDVSTAAEPPLVSEDVPVTATPLVEVTEVSAEPSPEDSATVSDATQSSDVVSPTLHITLADASVPTVEPATDGAILADVPSLSRSQSKDNLTPEDVPERPQSPWTPSYSVTSQGSPRPEAKTLPDEPTNVQPVIATTVTAEEPSSIILPDKGAQAETEAPSEPVDRPKSPWTPSYSVTYQGSAPPSPQPSTRALDAPDTISSNAAAPVEEALPAPNGDLADASVISEVSSVPQLHLADVASATYSDVSKHTIPDAKLDTEQVAPPPVSEQTSGHAFKELSQAHAEPPTITIDETATPRNELSETQAFPSTAGLSGEIPAASALDTVPEPLELDTTPATLEPVDGTRKRLESTSSSRFFPGGWFSSSPTIEGRTSLENAQGEFTPSKSPIDMSGTSAPAPTPVDGLAEDEERKSRWCTIM